MKIYTDEELKKRRYASVGNVRKDWNCQRCSAEIPKGSQNETSWSDDRTAHIRLCLKCAQEIKTK